MLAGGWYMPTPTEEANTAFGGSSSFASSPVAKTVCVWSGISETSSVMDSTPTHLAEVAQRESLPLAGLHGSVSLQVGQREGGLAVTAVGRAEQREERGVLRDRHQLPVAEGPAGRRKLNGKMRISATNWSDICFLL